MTKRVFTVFAIACASAGAQAQCGGWSNVGGDSPRVQALLVHDNGSGAALYAGGVFPNGGGSGAVEYVARFDGTVWSSLQGGVSGGLSPWIWTLEEFDDGSGAGPALFVGGSFARAGGIPANNVARWDGTSWSALGNGLGVANPDGVMALEVFDDGTGPALYAAGNFTSSGGVAVQNVARWNGSAWSPLSGGLSSSNSLVVVRALEVYDDGTGAALYAGGWFDQAAGSAVQNLARWNGSTWSAVGGGVSGVDLFGISALQAHDDGAGPSLFAGGGFTTAGSVAAANVARWDGTAWNALGMGIGGSGVGGNPPNVVELGVHDPGSGPALTVGGWFTLAGGSPAAALAVWAGAKWTEVGAGVGGGVSGGGPLNGVFGLETFDDGAGNAMYVGGTFTAAGNVPAASVARWRAASPSSYCSAGTSSQGCVPTIGSSGTPSASAPSGFPVTLSGTDGQRIGLIFFGSGGATNLPFGSGFLCVRPPMRRTGIGVTSGTVGQCDGSIGIDFNTWISTHPITAPPAGQTDQTVPRQYRDRTLSTGLGISHAIGTISRGAS